MTTFDPRTDPQTAVEVLLQALPYIEKFRGSVVVVKFGGNAMVDPDLFARFAEDVVLMHRVGMKPVVVHGGGPQIGEWLARMGKESEFVDGRRVTDAETLEVAKMVLIGKVNSDVVTALNRFGPVALGLSGTDAQLLTAAAHDPELGFVGQVTGVDTTLIERTLAMDLVPVIATIGADAEGQAYNINADDVASNCSASSRGSRPPRCWCGCRPRGSARSNGRVGSTPHSMPPRSTNTRRCPRPLVDYCETTSSVGDCRVAVSCGCVGWRDRWLISPPTTVS